GFLRQFAPRGIVNGFIHVNESARQCPASLERLQPALDEQHLEFGLIETEHDAVHRQSRTGIFVGVWHKRSEAKVRFSPLLSRAESIPSLIDGAKIPDRPDIDADSPIV